MQRVVFIEQFYFPEAWGGAQIPRDITAMLAGCKLDVEVICGGDRYVDSGEDLGQDPRGFGIRITRIPKLFVGSLHKHKLLRQIWFYLAALPVLLFRRSPDIFITQTNPPLIVPIVAFAALVHRRPAMIIAQDLYPEIVFAQGMLSRTGFTGRCLTSLFRWAYSRAHCVISLGPEMSERLVEKGVRSANIALVSNWATGDLDVVRGEENELRNSWGLNGKFVVVYSGNLGFCHDVETPIKAISDLAKRVQNLQLIFIGSGSRLRDARRLVESEGMADFIQFRSFVPGKLLPHSFGLADVALVTMRRDFGGFVVPSKLLGYMARGVPTVYVGPKGDMQLMIEASGTGLCVPNGGVAELARVLHGLMQSPQVLANMAEAGKAYYESHYARDVALASYRDLITTIIDERERDQQPV